MWSARKRTPCVAALASLKSEAVTFITSSAFSSSASSSTNDGRPVMPRPASAAAYSVSVWVVVSAERGGTIVTVDPARSVIEDFRRLKQPRVVEKDAAPDEPLTEREAAVLEQIGAGKSNKAIAQALGLAEGTVKNYVSNILAKLHARSRTELAIRASR